MIALTSSKLCNKQAALRKFAARPMTPSAHGFQTLGPGVKRLMGLEVRMWFGGKVTPIVAAFHALLFWLSLTIFFPILLWPLFDSRKRCLHDILAGVVVINRV